MNKLLASVAQNPAALGSDGHGKAFAPDAWTSAWKPLLAGPAANPMGVDWFAMVFGLGFVLSFGYWCTNFLVVQRAMAAKNMTAARRTPLIAAVPKMLFPVLVIVPGMIAVALTAMPGQELPHPAADHSSQAGLCQRPSPAVKSASHARTRRRPSKPLAEAHGQENERRPRSPRYAPKPRPRSPTSRSSRASTTRRRIRLRRRHPLAGEEVLSARPARAGAHRACSPRSCPAWPAT